MNVDLFLFVSGLRKVLHAGRYAYKGKKCGSLLYEADLEAFEKWTEFKQEHGPGAVHLFEMEDSYEAYFLDAVIVHSILSTSIIQTPGPKWIPGAEKELRGVGSNGGRFLVAKMPGPACRVGRGLFPTGRDVFKWDVLSLRHSWERDIVLLEKPGQSETAGPPRNVISLSNYRKRAGVARA